MEGSPFAIVCLSGSFGVLIVLQELMDCFSRYEVLVCELDIPTKPTLHMFMHMTSKARTDGSPAHLACFLDESLNVVLAWVSRAAHRAVWHERMFENFEQNEVCRKENTLNNYSHRVRILGLFHYCKMFYCAISHYRRSGQILTA